MAKLTAEKNKAQDWCSGGMDPTVFPVLTSKAWKEGSLACEGCSFVATVGVSLVTFCAFRSPASAGTHARAGCSQRDDLESLDC